MSRFSIGAAALLVMAALTSRESTHAQQTPAQTPSLRIEGTWVRKDTVGAGSFGGLGAGIPAAVLTAEAAAGRRGGGPGGPARGTPPPARPVKPGEPVIVVDRPCGGGGGGRGNGALLINPDSGGVHIVEHKDEVIFAGERGGVRHIYTDGRPHPAPGGWVPTGAGHSIGRYEGNVLVVETVGMTPGGVVGGGQRTAETKLTERFEVAPDGQSMTITYSWEDAKIFQKPHVYKYSFDRLPPGSYAFEDWCDASDPIEKYSVTPPIQK